ncbi:hypothetical protein N9290_04755 [Flavobacteriaceae bacterium]|jgi:hypothetical protein|nr:hypothetical protein [Flavobacteriaceae bacterium]MDB4560435.1 hypothetical protein [Flavobacteriaceae bacterium]
MKKILLICFSLLVSCSSIQQETAIQKINYKAMTRGYSTEIVLQDNTLKYFKNTKENRSLTLTEEVKDSLNTLVKKINLNTINQLKAPSNEYQFDGAMYATVAVILNGKTYTSAGFDDDNPPKELIPLVNYLLTLIK